MADDQLRQRMRGDSLITPQTQKLRNDSQNTLLAKLLRKNSTNPNENININKFSNSSVFSKFNKYSGSNRNLIAGVGENS